VIVNITTTDGRKFSKQLDYPKGDPRNPLSDAEIEEKFRALADGVLSKKAQDKLIAAIWNLENCGSVRTDGVDESGCEKERGARESEGRQENRQEALLTRHRSHMTDLKSTMCIGPDGAIFKTRERTSRTAVPLSEEQFWIKPFAFGNSFGHLVLHLTGNLNYYIGRRSRARATCEIVRWSFQTQRSNPRPRP